MPYTPSTADAAAVLAAAYLAKRFLSHADSVTSLPLPPGPPGLPIIHNALDMPQTQPHLAYMEWAEKYGPIMHVSVLSRQLIIVNDIEIAKELLVHRATSSSDRATKVMAGILSGWNNFTPYKLYGPQLRTHRRYFNAFVGARVTEERHSALLESAARQMVLRLMRTPNELEESVQTMAGSVVLKIAYGYTALAAHDPLVELIETGMNYFSYLSDSSKVWAVDLFPMLQHLPAWLPGASFKRTAEKSKDALQRMAQVPFDAVKAKMRDGTAESCLVTDLLAKCDSAQDEDDIKWVATAMYGAGADTTVSTLLALFLALTLYPDVQKKAQAELDAVVGNARLPTLTDRPKLPYIDAIVSETLRWFPVVPIPTPHKLTRDELYGGYHLPTGALIAPNIYAMLRDPATYADPDVFRPERFFTSEDKPAEPDPRAAFFGFGRRICPGQHLADASVWATTAAVLATLSVTKARDGTGAEITPELRLTDGLIVRPKPFECVIKPRSAQVEALVIHELAQYGCDIE